MYRIVFAIVALLQVFIWAESANASAEHHHQVMTEAADPHHADHHSDANDLPMGMHCMSTAGQDHKHCHQCKMAFTTLSGVAERKSIVAVFSKAKSKPDLGFASLAGGNRLTPPVSPTVYRQNKIGDDGRYLSLLNWTQRLRL